MSNLLEYTLSLNDQMSAKLQKIGVNSSTALNVFAKLEQQTLETNRVLKATGNSVGSLRQKLDLLRAERDWIPQKNITTIRKYNTEIKKLERQITRFETINGSRTKRWFSEAFNQVPMAGLLLNPLVLAGIAGGKALSLGIEAEMQKTSFEVILGSKEAAKGLIGEIAEYAKKTPYQKLGLGDAAKTMLGFGMAQDKIMPNLKAIGDVAMGDANKMKSLTLAFAQMSSAGKLNGQDLNQMINAGFNPLGEISKKTGKSIGQLKDEMAKGAISSKMVESAFISATSKGGKFNGMADKMSKTLGGRWSTMLDNISEKFLLLFGAIEPVASLFLDMANYGLEAVSSGISFLTKKLKEGNPVMMIITGTLLSIATAMTIIKIATMAQATWTSILTLANSMQTASWWSLNAAMLANPITWIIAGVIGLVSLIGFLIYKIDGWGEAWTNTVEGGKALWGAYMSYLKLGWLGFEHAILSGIDLIKIAWYKLKSLWDEDGATEALAKIQAKSDARKEAIKKEGKEIVTQTKKAGSSFSKGYNSLSWNDKGLGDFKNDMSSKLGIAPPKTVGSKTVTTNLTTAKNNKNNSKNTQAVTGGTKHNYITIKLNDLVGEITIKGADFKESVNQLEDQTADALLRVLALATTAGS